MRAPELTLARARKLRREMSLPEVVLWDHLRANRLAGLRFRRQHPVGPYILDFYCPSKRLAIEVDGAHHDHPGQMHQDRRRDAWLARNGVRVLRIAAADILDDHALEGMLVMIAHAAAGARDIAGLSMPVVSHSKAPPPPPSAVPLPRSAGEDQAAALDSPSLTGDPRFAPMNHARHGGGGLVSRTDGTVGDKGDHQS